MESEMKKLLEELDSSQPTIEPEKCFYCDKEALYFDKVMKRGGHIKILRKKYDIQDGEPEEVFVCQTHYDIEVAKPIDK